MIEKSENAVVEKSSKPSWVKMKSSELEKIVVELAKAGKTPAEIGLFLRDQHGIPKAKLLGKKISKILDDADVDYKDEGKIMASTIDNLKKHFAKNKHDYSASRALTKRLWALKRMEKN